ncbi:MAG: tetratricopeptide repeat protein [Methylococcales bacterium]|jgi:tetratricopeptide (TPR) repeat protein|nr:tetratricopeptide repeat protein [Methylococcales bacterium]MBT7443495.1 tetratricopeptide repeat protein [Methylococcales bacterium]
MNQEADNIQLERAENLLKQENWAQAHAVYLQIMQDEGESDQLLTKLGQTCFRQSQVEPAIDYFTRALALNSEAVEAHMGLVYCASSMGDIAQAVERCKHVLEFKPGYQPAHVMWASLLLPGAGYTEVLKHCHQKLKPKSYVEIGVESGKSLTLANPPTQCVGIDPKPQVVETISAPHKIFALESDIFFQQHDLLAELGCDHVDMAFIDGMHHCENVLRDFINIEKFSQPNTVVLIHDCVPLDTITSTRERNTNFWSGDIWKVIPCLKKFRPDLGVFTIPAAPTGLGLVVKLNASSTVLEENMEEALAYLRQLEFDYLDEDKSSKMSVIRNAWPSIDRLLPR